MRYLDLIVQKGFPVSVSFNGSVGVDAGGLRKELVSHLVKSLQPHLSLIEDQLPLIELEALNAEDKKETLRKFGVFLSGLYEQNVERSHDPFLIGQLFHPRFFDIVKLILDNQSDDQMLEPLARILQEVNSSRSALTNVILNPDDTAAQETFAECFGFNMDTDNIAEEAKKILASYLVGPRAFASGLSPQLQAFIRQSSCQEICSVLQGQEASVEALFSALGIQEIDASSETEDLFENQKRWLKEKIRDSDPAWRKAFIQWATGRTTLAPATSIILQSTYTRGLAAHTCSNTIDFPIGAISKEAFLADLDLVIGDLQFSIA